MFEPPKNTIDFGDLFNLINLMESAKQLDYDILLQYLNLKPNRIGNTKTAEFGNQASRSIPEQNSRSKPSTVFTYLLSDNSQQSNQANNISGYVFDCQKTLQRDDDISKINHKRHDFSSL